MFMGFIIHFYIIFGTNLLTGGPTHIAGRGRTHPPGRALHPRGPLVAPLTDFFRLYISIYPRNIVEKNRSRVPPPQASVATKNQSGPCSGTLPEGESITEGFYINTIASPMKCE